MNKYKELQDKHMALLEKLKTEQSSEKFIRDIETYIEDVKKAGKDIPSSQERDQLRANLRFWGAFIYERKKIFPDINLWPSIRQNQLAEWRRDKRFRFVMGILGVIILVLVVALVIPRMFGPTAQQPNAVFTLAALTVQAMSTQPILFNTPTIPPLTATEVVVVQNVSNTLPATQTPIIAQASAVSSSTPIVALASSAALPTVAVGAASPQLAGFSYWYSDCTRQKIEIEWQEHQPSSENIEDAVAYVSLSGSGEVVGDANLIYKGNPAIIELANLGSDQSYLLQIKHSKVIFNPIIIQFTPDADCLSIIYRGYNNLVNQSPLHVELTLVDWGPDAPAGMTSWIAKLAMNSNEGGIYMDDQSQIIEQTFFARGTNCFSSSPSRISRTHNGEFQQTSFSLFMAGPLCPRFGVN